MGDHAVRAPLSSVDFTIKPDADTLGSGWIDGHAWDPAIYEPIGIRNGAVVCTNPTARAVTYAEDQEAVGSGLEAGELLGIGCAWRPTIYEAPTITMQWSGWAPGADWVEAAILVNVVPGTNEHGFGVWASSLLGTGILLVGSISNPSYDFADNLLCSAFFTHTAGTPREIQVRSDGEAITIWLDGSQASLNNGYGTNPVPIPAALLGSKMHGLAVDAHLTTPPENIPNVPCATSWAIEAS